MLSNRCFVCLSVCLSVTLVYCGQTVGWIEMKLGIEVGLGPDHIALDGIQVPPPKGGWVPPILGPYLMWPNGWRWFKMPLVMEIGLLWPHCVRWGPSAPPKGHSPLPQFSANVCCGMVRRRCR